ncbi:hypothetical protein CLV84_3689 [Neolewinella xylanilytica]|uniref:Tetratricopeptide repeat protein n=1 Tax=Neolewinella xylanilytica TaxID=1514080 RepID=A0A2S6I0N2_9BACT|nr:hypothetical protein [Neolewinella xylanilytica]PPK84529.1 hypothetical protein CLV84_3689 [Neolewinella xylanilytica]
MRSTLLLLFASLSLVAAAAEYHYDFHREAEAIYEDVMRLELDLAEAGIERLQRDEPRNLVAHHLGSYVDFFRLYLSGDERLDARLQERFDRRIELLERGDPASPYFNYALAEAFLHRSLIDVRFERHLAAFRSLNRANKYLLDNADRFPQFLPTFKDLGLLQAAVGTIPPQYKWGVELFSSLTGTIPAGRKLMQRAVADRESPFATETSVLHALMELYLADDAERALRTVTALDLQPATNKLHCFVLATIIMRNDRNADALRILEAQPRGGSSAEFPYLDFLLGQAKLRNLNPRARLHYQSFLLRYPGRHFREEALQKIAWSYLLEADVAGYHRAMAEIEAGSRAGGDESATREAMTGKVPHLDLLKARLLFDGGYFSRARQRLDAIDRSKLTTDENLEFLYRTGRVLDGLKDHPGALSFYERTISLGRDNPAYFACNAALQAGLLEEDRGRYPAARKYFTQCLELSPAEYRTGLHMMAKAGLDRISGKMR